MVVLITGTTGIAEATAALAREQGHQTFLAGLPAFDLTTAEAAARGVKECVSLHGRIDALFNVAGASGRACGDGPLHECTDEGWQWTIEANLGTAFRAGRAVLRQMLIQERNAAGQRGTILNMSSVVAFDPEAQHFTTHAYAAAKGAILALTRSMAARYAAEGIRVNAIAPGLVRTPMSDRAQSNREIITWVSGRQPLAGGMLDAAEIARAALFLLGDESRFITGQTLVVDGGWTIT
jgi:NAD(P)-dependent dehydrogenase (short-subunit alcohol dehydrogenase family)